MENIAPPHQPEKIFTRTVQRDYSDYFQLA